MGPHQLQDERSLAVHRLIAERIRENPRLLDISRARLAEWRRAHDMNARYLDAWDELLQGPLERLLAFLVERSQWATAMRHVSPFAGIVDFKTRDRIWTEVRDRLEAADGTVATSR